MDYREAVRQRLNLISKEIAELYDLLDSATPTMPKTAIEQLADGICLYCKKRMTKADQAKAKRGCHPKCHRNNLRSIERGEETDEGLIAKGFWAPKSRGGRPRSRPADSADRPAE